MTRRKWPRVGDRVRLSPECGPNARRRFGDQVGTVVQLNRADREVGVTFTRPRRRADGSWLADTVSWFLPHELAHTDDTAPVAPSRPDVALEGGDT